MLNRDAILKAQDLKREIVDVPEWGGEVYVRGFTALEKEEVEIRSMSMVDIATGQIRDARQLAGLKAWMVRPRRWCRCCKKFTPPAKVLWA